MTLQRYRWQVLILASLATVLHLGCRAGETPPQFLPRVSAQLIGLAEPVFDTRDACEQIDIPDAIPRAFRDYQNRVHLIASHYVARAMVGATLDRVKHDCRVIYRSPHDPDPAHFLDENWLTSLYTEDGRRVAALAHTEYHGDKHSGMCGNPGGPNHAQDCAWTTITYAESKDGGSSFREPSPPGNLVASLPYVYDKNNRAGAQGYDSPTNIVKLGQYYYSLVNVWRAYKAQRYGPCLMRTTDLFDPASWRGWDGASFSVKFLNPYLQGTFDAASHVCFPIVEGTIDSIAIDERTRIILGDVYVEDNRYGQGPGLYVMASRDLIHWSKPTLAARTGDLLNGDHGGNYSYLYFALLDPASTDRNFATISSTPYIYYVRLDEDHPPYTRVLFRRRIQIAIAG